MLISLRLQTWAKNISDNLGFASPRFQVAATAEDPLWPFNAPGASSALDCVSALAAGANRDGVVKTCSEHTYQYSVSDRKYLVFRFELMHYRFVILQGLRSLRCPTSYVPDTFVQIPFKLSDLR